MSEYVKSLYGVLDVQLLINGKEEKWNLAALYKKYNVIIQMWGGIKVTFRFTNVFTKKQTNIDVILHKDYTINKNRQNYKTIATNEDGEELGSIWFRHFNNGHIWKLLFNEPISIDNVYTMAARLNAPQNN